MGTRGPNVSVLHLRCSSEPWDGGSGAGRSTEGSLEGSSIGCFPKHHQVHRQLRHAFTTTHAPDEHRRMGGSNRPPRLGGPGSNELRGGSVERVAGRYNLRSGGTPGDRRPLYLNGNRSTGSSLVQLGGSGGDELDSILSEANNAGSRKVGGGGGGGGGNPGRGLLLGVEAGNDGSDAGGGSHVLLSGRAAITGRDLSPVRWSDKHAQGVFLGRSGWVQVRRTEPQWRSLEAEPVTESFFDANSPTDENGRILGMGSLSSGDVGDANNGRRRPATLRIPPRELRRCLSTPPPELLDTSSPTHGILSPSDPMHPLNTPIISPPPAFQDTTETTKVRTHRRPPLPRSNAIISDGSSPPPPPAPSSPPPPRINWSTLPTTASPTSSTSTQVAVGVSSSNSSYSFSHSSFSSSTSSSSSMDHHLLAHSAFRSAHHALHRRAVPETGSMDSPHPSPFPPPGQRPHPTAAGGRSLDSSPSAPGRRPQVMSYSSSSSGSALGGSGTTPSPSQPLPPGHPNATTASSAQSSRLARWGRTRGIPHEAASLDSALEADERSLRLPPPGPQHIFHRPPPVLTPSPEEREFPSSSGAESGRSATRKPQARRPSHSSPSSPVSHQPRPSSSSSSSLTSVSAIASLNLPPPPRSRSQLPTPARTLPSPVTPEPSVPGYPHGQPSSIRRSAGQREVVPEDHNCPSNSSRVRRSRSLQLPEGRASNGSNGGRRAGGNVANRVVVRIGETARGERVMPSTGPTSYHSEDTSGRQQCHGEVTGGEMGEAPSRRRKKPTSASIRRQREEEEAAEREREVRAVRDYLNGTRSRAAARALLLHRYLGVGEEDEEEAGRRFESHLLGRAEEAGRSSSQQRRKTRRSRSAEQGGAGRDMEVIVVGDHGGLRPALSDPDHRAPRRHQGSSSLRGNGGGRAPHIGSSLLMRTSRSFPVGRGAPVGVEPLPEGKKSEGKKVRRRRRGSWDGGDKLEEEEEEGVDSETETGESVQHQPSQHRHSSSQSHIPRPPKTSSSSRGSSSQSGHRTSTGITYVSQIGPRNGPCATSQDLEDRCSLGRDLPPEVSVTVVGVDSIVVREVREIREVREVREMRRRRRGEECEEEEEETVGKGSSSVEERFASPIASSSGSSSSDVWVTSSDLTWPQKDGSKDSSGRPESPAVASSATSGVALSPEDGSQRIGKTEEECRENDGVEVCGGQQRSLSLPKSFKSAFSGGLFSWRRTPSSTPASPSGSSRPPTPGGVEGGVHTAPGTPVLGVHSREGSLRGSRRETANAANSEEGRPRASSTSLLGLNDWARTAKGRNRTSTPPLLLPASAAGASWEGGEEGGPCQDQSYLQTPDSPATSPTPPAPSDSAPVRLRRRRDQKGQQSSRVNAERESVLQRFRKSLSLRFHKKGGGKEEDGETEEGETEEEEEGEVVVEEIRRRAAENEEDDGIIETRKVESMDMVDRGRLMEDLHNGGEYTIESEKDGESVFRFGPLVWRSSKERNKKGKKAARKAKCNSGDSGIQIEIGHGSTGGSIIGVGGIEGVLSSEDVEGGDEGEDDGPEEERKGGESSNESPDSDHQGEEEDEVESPPTVKRRVRQNGNTYESRPRSDLLNQAMLERFKVDLQNRNSAKQNVRRTRSDLGGGGTGGGTGRTAPNTYRRQLSSPAPLKVRPRPPAHSPGVHPTPPPPVAPPLCLWGPAPPPPPTTRAPNRPPGAAVGVGMRRTERQPRLRRSLSQPVGIHDLCPMVAGRRRRRKQRGQRRGSLQRI